MKMMICEVCGSNEQIVCLSTEIIGIRKDQYETAGMVRKCKQCGNLFLDEMYWELHKEARELYRKQHDLLSPYEIKEIRNSYDMSQDLYGRAIGLSQSTINRYEIGVTPHKNMDMFFRKIQDPKEFLQFVETERKEKLDSDSYELIIMKINERETIKL